ncbi:hypothetical protein [Chenggangzhangella methanolivorans]|uniref:Uncharacterized protein n=1 Tax=Chenggangzhangella methanolivorans TaxID=1437009 RepID=A0A9E6RE77_9HYPH|nr:hypothetical protein [Chenggangzhangella methanolivorans]QZN99555.1 hypothetical protein K6K41_23065 [Chenggangzhangella methanolivorans]
MTIYFGFHDAKGEFLSWGECSAEQLEAQVSAEGLRRYASDQPFSAATHYMDELTLAPRPEIEPPATLAVAADGVDEAICFAPTGSLVVIDGQEFGVIDDDAFAFTSEEPGAYAIELRPPFPWRPLAFEVVAS